MSHYNQKKQKEVQRGMSQSLPTVTEIRCDWPHATREAFPERNILSEIYRYYDIRMGICEKTSKYRYLAFPATTNGKLTGWIRYDREQESDSGKWLMVGKANESCDMVGLFNANGQRLGSGYHKKIYVAEGMFDYLSIAQVLWYMQKEPGKYKPDACTIISGTPRAAAHIANNHKELLKYETFITVFDSDERKPGEKNTVIRGREATEEVHKMYPSTSFVCQLADGSDPNDYVARRDGLTPKELHNILWSPIQFQSDTVRDMSTFEIENPADKPIKDGVMVPEFPKLCKDMRGFRPNSLVLLIAPPKAGKSTKARAVQSAFIDQGKKTAGIYFEKLSDTEPVEQYICHDNKVPYHKWKYGEVTLTKDQIEKSKQKLSGSNLIDFKDSKVSIQEILQTARKEAINGTELLILDHGSYVVEGKKNWLELISELCTGLADIKKQYPICILLIAHITIDKDLISRLKAKNTSKGADEWDTPFWLRVNAFDARGGSGWLQLCDTAICVDKEYIPDDTMGRTQLKITDDRLLPCTGRKDTLTLDSETGRLKPEGREY